MSRSDVFTAASVSVSQHAGAGRDPVYWQLTYADDHAEDEPLTNVSVRLSHLGAVRIWACVPERGPNGEDLRHKVFGVNLIDAESGRLFRPIWYRKRSLDINAQEAGSIQLEATIIGRAIEDKEGKVEGTLFMTTDGVNFVDCPEWAFDTAAINRLLET